VGVPGDPAQDHQFGFAIRLRDIDRDSDADLLLSGQYSSGNVLLRAGADGVTTRAASEVKIRAEFPQ